MTPTRPRSALAAHEPDSAPGPHPARDAAAGAGTGWVRGAVWRPGAFSFRLQPRLIAITSALLAAAVLMGLFAMTVGTLDISVSEVFRIVIGLETESTARKVVLDVRLPRILTALFVGAALGISGGVFQSISRNALGSPDVIGFTTGAATGAIAQIVVFGGGPIATSVSAVTSGVLTALIVYALSVKGRVTGGYRLILTGIGVGSVLAALNNLMLVKGNLDNAVAANLWLAGSLNSRGWFHAIPVMIGVAVLLPAVVIGARRLTIIEMGDDFAAQFGISAERTRLLMIAAAVVLAALATGAAGPIAFVALAAPQLVRRLSRAQGVPVVSAAAMGAALLMLADLLSQLLPFSITLPIGRTTGLVGGIYLIWLLTRSKQL